MLCSLLLRLPLLRITKEYIGQACIFPVTGLYYSGRVFLLAEVKIISAHPCICTKYQKLSTFLFLHEGRLLDRVLCRDYCLGWKRTTNERLAGVPCSRLYTVGSKPCLCLRRWWVDENYTSTHGGISAFFIFLWVVQLCGHTLVGVLPVFRQHTKAINCNQWYIFLVRWPRTQVTAKLFTSFRWCRQPKVSVQ